MRVLVILYCNRVLPDLIINYASQDLNINTTGINWAYMKLPTHGIPGHETIYVECKFGDDKREKLFKKLRKSTSDAINVQFHEDQQGT